MFPHSFFAAAYYPPSYFAPAAGAAITNGGMGSYVPFMDDYALGAALKITPIKIWRGSEHPELNTPRQERERAAQVLAGVLEDDDELALLLSLI